MKHKTLKYPPVVFWETTPLCNHNCIHCFNYWRKNSDNTKDLINQGSEVSPFSLVEKIMEQNPVSVTVTGGEPLLVFDAIKPCIDNLLKNGISVNMNSNAALVTDSIALYLAENNIGVFVSYPCSYETICDTITNTPGSWKRINEGIDILKKHNVNFNCHMVISSTNIGYLEDTALYLKERYQIKKMTASRVGKPVNSSEEFDSQLLDSIQIRTLIEKCVDINNKYGIEIGASVPYAACSFDTQEEFDLLGAKRLCSAGKTSYVVDNAGNVKACPRTSKIYGNIFNECFFDIWSRMEEWRDGSLYPDKCRDCKSFKYCFSACRTDMLSQTGSCSKLDSTARPEKLPLYFLSKSKEYPQFDKSSYFNISKDIKWCKENEGYRISRGGRYAYISDKAYNFMKSTESFSLIEFAEKMDLDYKESSEILNRLIRMKLVQK